MIVNVALGIADGTTVSSRVNWCLVPTDSFGFFTDIATKVNLLKNQIEKQAVNWYIELRHCRYKFIAMYRPASNNNAHPT
jgi:hypothetical protein